MKLPDRLNGLLLYFALEAFGRSWRVELHGLEELEALGRRGIPVVLGAWHERLFGLAWFVARHMRPAGLEPVFFTSRSGDGELLAQTARYYRVEVLRGSTSRGGATALRGVYRTMSRDGKTPVNVPDGPRGPAHIFKPGLIVLAQLAQAPLFGLSFATDRAWELGSWDRMIVPKPFARVTYVIGPPMRPPRHTTKAEMAALQEEAGGALDRAGEEATRRLALRMR